MMGGTEGVLSWGYLQGVVGPSMIRWGFVGGLLLYSLFAVIILKQTRVMKETIDGKYNTGINAFAWLHLIMTLLLVVAALMLL